MTDLAVADLSHIPVSPVLSATLARASEGARASGAGEVSLEHLLAALCDDPDAIDVLAACNIDAGRLKGDVIGYLVQQQPHAVPPQAGGVGVSGALKRILEAAAAAAKGGRRRDINGAIVLAAIVGDARSTAAQILQSYGLTFEGAIRALQSAMAQPRASDVPPAEDVLARARERVQSRAAPSLREIMQERPQAFERTQPPPHTDIVPHASGVPQWETAAVPDAGLQPAAEAAPKAEPLPAPEPVSSAPPAAPATPREPESAAPPQEAPPSDTISQPEAAPITGTAAPADEGRHAPHSSPPPAATPVPSWQPPVPMQPPPPPAAYAPASAPAPGLPPGMATGGFGAPAPAIPGAYPGPPPGPGPLPAGFRPELPSGPAGAAPQPPFAPMAPPLQNQRFERPRTGPQPPPIPPPIPAPGSAIRPPVPPQGAANRYGAPPSVRAPEGPLARSAAPSSPLTPGAAAARDGRPEAELGLLAENIPRVMRTGMTERVEIRIGRSQIRNISAGMEGSGTAWQHDVAVTKAMSVRMRAPEGGFFIETASPEVQWIDNQFAAAGDDYASWRFLVTPQRSGWSELQIIVSARTVGSDGLAAETAFPDQVIEVKVRANYGRAFLKVLGWVLAAIAGGILAKFGEGAWAFFSALLEKLGQ